MRSSSPARTARIARRALQELIAGQRVEDALRDRAQPVAGPSNALEQSRDQARRADVADEVHVADVDAELQRRGRNHDRHVARLQALLGLEPRLAGEAAVVGGDAIHAQPLARAGATRARPAGGC